jgi:hypothetical protein
MIRLVVRTVTTDQSESSDRNCAGQQRNSVQAGSTSAENLHHDTNSFRGYAGFTGGAKLGTYSGSTCLETFLARFESCAKYFLWNSDDKLFQFVRVLRVLLDRYCGIQESTLQ